MKTSMYTFRLNLLMLGFACLLLVGCDPLEFDDPNAPSADALSLQNLATGTEGSMRSEIEIYLQTTSIFGREAYYFEPADPRYTGELYTGPLDGNGFLVVDPWSSRYRTVKNALDLIDRARSVREETPSQFSEEDLSASIGFGQTIIGYQLLLVLTSTWDNGLKIEFSDDVNTPIVSRSEAFTEINRYLDDGYANLQAGGDFPFQLSSGFGDVDFAAFNRAIRARAAAYQEDYDTVLDALDDSFLLADESELDLGAYHLFGTGTGERVNPLFEVPTSSTVKLRAHPSLEADAVAGDERFSTKVLDRTDDEDFVASPSAANGLSSKLAVAIWDGSTSPISIIRNEELLLLRAEARILGPNQDLDAAVDDLNIVREAAGLGPYTGSVTESDVFDEMVYNRRYSLFLEGHRWVDARRFGLLNTLPVDAVGDPPSPAQIFSQVPIPLDEIPEN